MLLQLARRDARTTFTQAISATDKGVMNVISNVYYVAKNDVAIRKVESLHEHSKLQGAVMPNTMYLNITVAWEILVTAIRESKIFSIIIDESTDISIHKNLIIYAKYYQKEYEARVSFLKLLELEGSKAADIEARILSYCQEQKLELPCLIGFGSDGASVMFGRLNAR